ncbi:MAG: hypothetical protein ABID38_01680 [Candidatus Diapherotrites archaeon]
MVEASIEKKALALRKEMLRTRMPAPRAKYVLFCLKNSVEVVVSNNKPNVIDLSPGKRERITLGREDILTGLLKLQRKGEADAGLKYAEQVLKHGFMLNAFGYLANLSKSQELSFNRLTQKNRKRQGGRPGIHKRPL